MKYFNISKKGIFVSRPNRFIVCCMVDGRQVKAYLPNPGRLWELFFPGVVLYLTINAGGSTGYTVAAVERDGIPMMLHTHANNLVARRLIESGSISGLEGAHIVRPEITIGRSRFDFLVNQAGQEIVVEVKSCTLVGNRIAMFPDAVTARGTRHLQELAELSKEGKKGLVLFLVHWAKADYFMPEWHTDLELTRTLLAVKEQVMIKAVSVEWLRDMTVGQIRDVLIPWNLVEQEAHDRGSYIIIVRMKRDRRLLIGGLGDVKFKKGYYCCVGSAKENLTQRLEQHRRLRKNPIGHIDYLRAAADYHAAIPIRSSEDLECEVARSLAAIADRRVPGFGSSDCGCPTRLFGMNEDPLHSRSFIDMLIYFRMDRLEKYLNTVQYT
jgi:sugar fermentation stimulation protein A